MPDPFTPPLFDTEPLLAPSRGIAWKTTHELLQIRPSELISLVIKHGVGHSVGDDKFEFNTEDLLMLQLVLHTTRLGLTHDAAHDLALWVLQESIKSEQIPFAVLVTETDRRLLYGNEADISHAAFMMLPLAVWLRTALGATLATPR